MAFGVLAAVRRSPVSKRGAGAPPAAINRARQHALAIPSARGFPELDCVCDLLPRSVILAAERRARSIGLGADRVLIAADAITEEAYLDALAASLGTSFEPLEGVARTDCPLDDHELIQAAAAGLLPLREGNTLTWIVAPRSFAARRLADRCQSPPQWLRPFRFTTYERLRHFVVRHTQMALGLRATETLYLAWPRFSNAPRGNGARRRMAIVAGTLAAGTLVFAPAAATAVLGVLFLSAAGLRLASTVVASPARRQPLYGNDEKLPIYTIICALYREAAVVNDLVAAIRALDYPGIMAQAPQAD